MRLRLTMALGGLGLVVVCSLFTYSRSTARDAIVPAPVQTAADPLILPVDYQETSKSPNVPTIAVNSRKIRLNYSVSDVGPSGVSAIELWATRDGRSWQRYSDEPPPNGPLVVHVAEEGRYGFSIVVKSGVGLSSPAPRSGQAPQLWVDVDETRPVVYLKDVYLGKGREAGSLHICWAATDAHLMPRPITIYMSKTKDGPWTPIASSIENTGSHCWQMPRDVPFQFYIKVEAADRAGNVGCACQPEPMKVDLSRPRGTILGVDVEKKPVIESQIPPIQLEFGVSR
jgi:hypothetical protein